MFFFFFFFSWFDPVGGSGVVFLMVLEKGSRREGEWKGEEQSERRTESVRERNYERVARRGGWYCVHVPTSLCTKRSRNIYALRRSRARSYLRSLVPAPNPYFSLALSLLLSTSYLHPHKLANSWLRLWPEANWLFRYTMSGRRASALTPPRDPLLYIPVDSLSAVKRVKCHLRFPRIRTDTCSCNTDRTAFTLFLCCSLGLYQPRHIRFAKLAIDIYSSHSLRYISTIPVCNSHSIPHIAP